MIETTAAFYNGRRPASWRAAINSEMTAENEVRLKETDRDVADEMSWDADSERSSDGSRFERSVIFKLLVSVVKRKLTPYE